MPLLIKKLMVSEGLAPRARAISENPVTSAKKVLEKICGEGEDPLVSYEVCIQQKPLLMEKNYMHPPNQGRLHSDFQSKAASQQQSNGLPLIPPPSSQMRPDSKSGYCGWHIHHRWSHPDE